MATLKATNHTSADSITIIGDSKENLIAEDNSHPQPNSLTVLGLIQKFLDYAQFEIDRAVSSVEKYRDCLINFAKRIGDIDVRKIDSDLLTDFRKIIRKEGIGENREASFINTLRVFLKYCKDQLGLDVIDYTKIKPPKIPKRVPDFIIDDDLKTLIESIKLSNLDGSTNIPGLRFRALVELILSTGVRISEALSIKISDIDYEQKEIKLIGKGNKERIVYLTSRAVAWINKYLQKRKSDNGYLFVTRDGSSQLKVHDLWRFFQRDRDLLGLKVNATAHTLRRTFATKLRDNGVDITIISELLGHADINTTAKYYIGTNPKQNKAAHQEFLTYDI